MKTKSALIGLSLVVLLGCAHTITPDVVRNHEASAGAGLIAPSVNGGPATISPSARQRYNSLVDLQPEFRKHGKAFPVLLKHDDGVTPLPDGNFSLDAYHLEIFATMSSWFREGLWH